MVYYENNFGTVTGVSGDLVSVGTTHNSYLKMSAVALSVTRASTEFTAGEAKMLVLKLQAAIADVENGA